ncbi:hypothetical protein AFLA_002220 [Aspergillus flavus NRRL3357]|nr:hypothetical protein AFLA_002220 [Aspergillus flavus NRRL3357]
MAYEGSDSYYTTIRSIPCVQFITNIRNTDGPGYKQTHAGMDHVRKSGDLGGEDRRVGQGDDVDDFHCWDPTDETRCPVGSTRLVFISTVLSSGLSFDSCGRRIRSRARILKTSCWEGLMPMAGGDGDDGLTC